MNVYRETVLLFTAVAGILLLASVVGYVLKARVAQGKPHSTIDNLNDRVKAWWLMVITIGLAFSFGRTGVIVLFALISFQALREFATLAPTRRGDYLPLLIGFFIVIPVQYFFVWIEWYGLYSIFIPVYVFLVLPILAALSKDTWHFMERAAIIQWGMMLCVFCISYVPALLTLEIPGYDKRHALLVFYLIFVVQLSDVLQYVWGKMLGRHKIAPELSPSKTVEGFLGGVLSASAVGAALWWITPFSPGAAALISLAITLMGFLGGLVMSAIKRDRGAKDWGTLIGGHGGVLDRLDSVCFAAPVFFHIVRYWWTV